MKRTAPRFGPAGFCFSLHCACAFGVANKHQPFQPNTFDEAALLWTKSIDRRPYLLDHCFVAVWCDCLFSIVAFEWTTVYVTNAANS